MANNSSSVSGGGKNSTALAAAAAAAARKAAALKREHQQELSKDAVKHFGIAISAVIILFSVFHWSRFLYSRYASTGLRKSGIMRLQVSITRIVRNVLTHRVPGFTSIGHAVLVLIYLIINISLIFTNMDYSTLTPLGKRFGWIALANVAFVTFLALKNTPLAFLTYYSYERLNMLHQVAGYTTVALGLIHGSLLSAGFVKIHFSAILLENTQVHAIVAFTAIFISTIFAILIRRMRYEVFYVVHITMYVVFIVNLGYHQPAMAEGAVVITIFAGSIWASDRILRGCRVLWYSYDNRATITPLVNGGTRIVLRRSPSRAVPGTHCFLWIPKIRALETHPFTIVSNSPSSLELVISAYDGFTNDLHNYALKNPGAVLRASIDGPYGAIPNFAKTADKVILIAGGSGASFTFGIAMDILKRSTGFIKPSIDFVWTVPEQESLSWFQKELAQLRASNRVNIILHATRLSGTSSPASPADNTSPISPTSTVDIEKQMAAASTMLYIGKQQDHSPIDDEKATPTHGGQATMPWDSTSSVSSLSVLPGRPDIDAIIQDIISKTSKDERIAIAACGPDTLMWNVRKTATNCITVQGPSIELHCEQFGW